LPLEGHSRNHLLYPASSPGGRAHLPGDTREELQLTDPSPLSPEQKSTLAAAATRLEKVTRPARIARFNAWTIGIFGGLTILWGVASGGGGVLVGIALLAIAWNEMRGVRLLQAIEPEGARVLGWNQLLVAAVIAGYCVFAILGARRGPDESMRELEEAAGISSETVADLTLLIYGSVAVVVGLVQALLARYHFRAGAAVEAFRRETPAWAIELLSSTRPAS
jgi:hypothetical protein